LKRKSEPYKEEVDGDQMAAAVENMSQWNHRSDEA
jgi:hypothetical protein